MILIKGDLFSTKADIIAHGVNLQGKFGAGIAKEIARRHPLAKNAYLHRFNSGLWRLGDVQFIRTEKLIIANIATQEFYGRKKQLYLDYSAMEIGLKRVMAYAIDGDLSVAIPMIGCGLAGGDPAKLLNIFKEVSLSFPSVALEVYTGY